MGKIKKNLCCSSSPFISSPNACFVGGRYHRLKSTRHIIIHCHVIIRSVTSSYSAVCLVLSA